CSASAAEVSSSSTGSAPCSSTTRRSSARRGANSAVLGTERRDGAYRARCAEVSQAVITSASAAARSSGSRSALTIARSLAARRPPNSPGGGAGPLGGRCRGDGSGVVMASSSQIAAAGAEPGGTVVCGAGPAPRHTGTMTAAADPARTGPVVGPGPRGTAIVERLVAASNGPHWRGGLTVHLIDPLVGRGGAVWRDDQPEVLLMNTTTCQTTMYPDESCHAVLPVPRAETLAEHLGR